MKIILVAECQRTNRKALTIILPIDPNRGWICSGCGDSLTYPGTNSSDHILIPYVALQ